MRRMLLTRLYWGRVAGWSSQVARRAHNPEVAGSNPAPATFRRAADKAARRISAPCLREDRRRRIGSSSRQPGEVAMASLYERLGGLDAITAVVDSFVTRCAGDDRINGKFARTDVPRLKKMLVDQVCEATGGPCTYTGRNMRETHDGMGVTAGGFDALVADLVATLDGLEGPKAEQDEMLRLLGPMRDEIVEVEAPDTRTPPTLRYQ